MNKPKIRFSKFISVQPFWDAKKLKNQIISSNETDRETAIIYEILNESPVYDCVPGIGLIGIAFSQDPQALCPICFGTLDAPKKVPLFGVKKSLLCHFLPGEFTRIFGIPCDELTNKEIPLEDLIAVGTVAEEILEAHDFEVRIALVKEFIRSAERKAKPSNTNLLTKDLMCEILQNNGDVRIKELEDRTGYSARYLQRILSENVGLSPKVVSENIRFQYVLREMQENPQLSLTEIAHKCGFYDQSHFTRMFKEYAGISPSIFLENLKRR